MKTLDGLISQALTILFYLLILVVAGSLGLAAGTAILENLFQFVIDDVVSALNLAMAQYGEPERIRVDDGPEFISQEMDLWAHAQGVILDFSRPGKPTDMPASLVPLPFSAGVPQ